MRVERIPVPKHQVGILAFVYASYPVPYSDYFCGIDRYRFHRVNPLHSCLDRQRCAKRKVLYRNHRMIRHYGDFNARIRKNPGCLECQVLKLELGSFRKARSYDRSEIFLLQMVDYEVPLCAVLNCHVQIEFLGYSYCGHYVVRPVGVSLDGQLLFNHFGESFHLEVEIGLIGIFVRFRKFFLFNIFFRLYEVFPQKGRRTHSCDRRLFPVVVSPFGIFPKCALYCARSLHNHVVYADSPCLYDRELPSYDICASRSGGGCRYSSSPGFLESPVHGVDGVDRPHFGGYGIDALISVRSLKSYPVLPHSQMRMGIYESRVKLHAFCVQKLRTL